MSELSNFVELPRKIQRNLVVSAPTGSGKTTAFVRNLPHYLEQFSKVYMLFPTKALIHQVTTVLSAAEIDFLRDDSDARLDHEITLRDWYDYDLIVTSYEKADSAFLLRPKLANDSLIMIDEVHLATTERALSILSILANCRDRAKFVVMSATIPNLNELADYLDADVVEFKKDKNVQVYEHRLGSKPSSGWDYNRYVAEKVLEIISAEPNVPTIVFRASRKQCESLAVQITQTTPARAMPFHSGIDKKVREQTISMFLNGEIDILVATSSLAYGVNTPAERIIIGGLSIYTFEGWKSVTSVDVVQMMGRAGRPGYSDRAEVHVIYFDEEEHILRSALSENYAEEIGIKSDLDTILLRLIMCNRIRSKRDVEKISTEWFNVPPTEEWLRALEELREDGLVTDDFKLSDLGRLIAKHYITVKVYRTVKGLIFDPPTSRKDKLDRIGSAVFEIRPASYGYEDVPDYLDEIASTEESKKVLAQLCTVTGDTDQVAEAIKKLSFFLHEATKDDDWLVLAKTMTFLRRLARNENVNVSGVLKAYVDGTVETLIEQFEKARRRKSRFKTRKRAFKIKR